MSTNLLYLSHQNISVSTGDFYVVRVDGPRPLSTESSVLFSFPITLPMHLSQVLELSKKQLQDSSKTIFRALGLNVISSFFSFLRYQTVGKGYTEQTKVAIRRNRTTALLRALIHVVPVGVALWEIVLNWNTYFVGYDIYNLAYYQFGAKLHEIAIQASLSAVIFSYVRYELMLGDGIPFGALFSGLQISQASYLWSMEFWGTICSRTISSKSKLRLLIVVTTSIFLAAVTGPSSAILLVPRSDYWPAGRTNIWINVTSDDLWPTHINASYLPKQCLNANISDIYAFACPFHGWEAIQRYIYITVNDLDPKYLNLIGLLDTPNWVEVTGHRSQRRLYMVVDYTEAPGYDPNIILATTSMSVVADALTETGSLWSNTVANISTSGHGSVLERQDAVHAINSGYYQPYTVASCAKDVIRGPQDNSAVAFPIPPDVEASQMLKQAEYNTSVLGISSFLYLGITKHKLFDTPGSVEQSRLKWVELPQNPFNGSAIGAIILLPRSTMNLTQEILVCNMGAGWGSSLLNTSSFLAGTTFTTSVVDPPSTPKFVVNRSQFGGNIISQAENTASIKLSLFDLPLFPQEPIIITEDWANYLNPFIPSLDTTVVDALMSTSKPVEELDSLQQIDTAKWALSGLLANGLASIGATGTLQGDIKTVMKPDGVSEWDGDYWFSGKGDMFIVDPEESKDWVKFRVDSTIDGYAYNIRGVAPKVAISFLLIYCIIALGHVLYAGITGVSSTCWDSIGEVTALAMNSTPTALLKNTCAGIMELNIFKLPVRVLAVRDGEEDSEHLELVFGNVDQKNARGTPIQPNRVYGTLPKMANKEKSE